MTGTGATARTASILQTCRTSARSMPTRSTGPSALSRRSPYPSSALQALPHTQNPTKAYRRGG
eukprot:536526-Rhodomonas_salina.1